jgi:hypothetical protein
LEEMRKLFTTVLLPLALTLCNGSELIIKTDAACKLTVDGKSKKNLAPNKTIHLKLPPGEHLLEAAPSAGGNTWRKTIALTAQAPQELTISLGTSLGFWVDPSTKFIWTAADNGSGLSWSQAQRYCHELTLAGFKEWVLPSIDDLQQISTATSNDSGFRIKGALKLTGWQWSATPGMQKGEGWAFDFGDGGRASVAAGDSGLNRALCIRRSQQ